MSWGFELWDQYESISVHTLKGIEFLERFHQFIKDRCVIENEYANKLRKLSKTYHIKKKEEEEMQFSTSKAFSQMMKEICDMAGQHELISENMASQVSKEILILSKELRDERKSHLQEGSKLQANLQASLNQLEKSKKAYEKAFKDSEKAFDHYQKALADLHLSRIELEKSRLNSVAKLEICEEAKKDYANQLQKTNEAQKQHYTELMPKAFLQLQDLDEKRILALQMYMKQTTDIQRRILPIINTCLDVAERAADDIDPKRDSLIVIGKYKTGLLPPGDIAFEELIPSKSCDTGTPPSLVISKTDTIKNTFSAPKLKKRGGLFSIFGANKNNIPDDLKEDYSDLPPNQRRKKLQQKIDNLTTQIQQESGARDGLLKMKAAYEQNSALGDPSIIDIQLPEINAKLEKLQNQLQRFKGYLSDAEGKSLTLDETTRNGSSILEESLSRSASDSSVHNTTKPSAPVIPLPHGIPNIDETDNGSIGEFDAEPLPALGVARALYPFDAQSEGSIPMEEGEDFFVVELDQGDGWTRVRRANSEEGFVPTSYIDCSIYSNC